MCGRCARRLARALAADLRASIARTDELLATLRDGDDSTRLARAHAAGLRATLQSWRSRWT
jgi:hypothetical protein